MKKTTHSALSTMNYLFLREVFGRNKDGESTTGDIISVELTLFLNALEEEVWTAEFKNLVKTELEEGEYLENLSMDDIKDVLSRAMINSCYEEKPKLVAKYMELVKEIKEIKEIK